MHDPAHIDIAISGARPKAIAALLRYFRDLDTAEEAFQEAYLIFNEGYGSTPDTAAARGVLADEAIRLGRLLLSLFPADPEVFGLLTLLLLQQSRAPARFDANGRALSNCRRPLRRSMPARPDPKIPCGARSIRCIRCSRRCGPHPW